MLISYSATIYPIVAIVYEVPLCLGVICDRLFFSPTNPFLHLWPLFVTKTLVVTT